MSAVFPDTEGIETITWRRLCYSSCRLQFSLILKGLRRESVLIFKSFLSLQFSLILKGLRPLVIFFLLGLNESAVFPDTEGIETPIPAPFTSPVKSAVFPDTEGIETHCNVGQEWKL